MTNDWSTKDCIGLCIFISEDRWDLFLHSPTLRSKHCHGLDFQLDMRHPSMKIAISPPHQEHSFQKEQTMMLLSAYAFIFLMFTMFRVCFWWFTRICEYWILEPGCSFGWRIHTLA